ncbi:hypothetical protein PsYK624_021830 [Phanerochaete sordida]|uniref:Uncharacterized protein n=1 Tax=Phanerochaete sordida TaxID=48140 RepID=A0A9P3FZH4_9APHY|nr:hypothetical protein PsYK624_021830 [Phanerochaete sordida]
MGSLCSKPGTHSEDGTQLRRVASARPAPRARPSARPKGKGQTLGHDGNGQSHDGRPDDPRSAAAQAAEERLKAAKTRGVVSANPNHGKLSAQLEANKAQPRVPQEREQERLVWD